MLSLFKQVASAPLLQFALAGLAIFGFWEWRDSEGEPAAFGLPSVSASGDIFIDEAALRLIVARFEAQWRRKPTTEELNDLVDDRIREEVLMREALRLGLDQGDQVIRRRLSQKLEMALEEIAALEQPKQEELLAYYREHIERFQRPAEVAFEHRFVSASRRGEGAQTHAQALLRRLSSGEQIEGDPFHHPLTVKLASVERLARVFGPAFVRHIERLGADSEGSWVGPIESPWGQHLVRIEEYRPAAIQDFAEVRDQVLQDWQETATEHRANERIDEMFDRYNIRVSALSPERSSEGV